MGKWPLLLILLGLLLLILPAQVEITVSDRLITDGHDVPASDRTTEVAAGEACGTPTVPRNLVIDVYTECNAEAKR